MKYWVRAWWYDLLWYVATPFIAAYLLWRGRKQKEYLQHWRERWGFYSIVVERPLIWVHAVSVGETQAAQPLIEALLQAYPEHRILLTHMTPTGRATGERLFGDRVQRAYLAYDYPCATARFFKHFQPVLGIVLETEIWPNLLRQAQKHRVPMALVNARLSEKSARKAARWGGLMQEALRSLRLIAAQTPADAQRLYALGAQDVVVTGNLKFDVAPDEALRALGQQWRAAIDAQQTRPVVLAASTREGEEALILEKLPALAADALLVLVPRHPQRFEEVAQLLQQQGIPFARRSQWQPGQAIPASVRVWLGDSMGEMTAYCSVCDAAFIGGSLLPLGGQNLIEACAVGKPILLGPHTFNFAQASEQAITAGAARRVDDATMMMTFANRILQHPAKQESMASAALVFSRQHRGATQRTLAQLKNLL
ncbi:MAG: 3-deoxy-D-manno-octulosonic acid transferase [Burkholderiaceae bacterium]|nr:MAG: 3-deoxy-D-manno-octulosonic acid transferase [Burkholderiaceae bacterium]